MIEAIMEVPTKMIKKIPASWDKDRPDTGYFYNAGAARYRDRTGKFISSNKLTNMRNDFIQKQKATVRSLANDLQTGKLTRTRWANAMRKQVNQTMTAEYLAGKGGVHNMTRRDYNILENSIKQQYEYFNNFEQQIKKDAASVDTAMSEERIAQRSELYMENTKKDFERAKVEARGMPNLPQYPGDGRTICGVNCKCTWDIKFVDGMWHATWRLHPAEHCPDCLANSTRYNPYIVAATRSALMHELEALV